MKDKLIYLASPYSHKKGWVQHLRHQLVTIVGAELTAQGFHIQGPIAESHLYQQYGDVRGSWTYWKKHDLMLIDRCDELWVLKLKGWKESTGVTAELAYAKKKGIPIKFITLKEILPNITEII